MLTRRSTGSTGPLAFALHAFLLPFFIFSNVLPAPLSLSVFLSRILTYIKPSFFPFLTRKESLYAHIQEFEFLSHTRARYAFENLKLIGHEAFLL